MAKRVTRTELTVAGDTGEFIKYIKKVVTVQDEDKYFMVFVDHLEMFYNITAGAQKDVLLHLAVIAEYNTNRISLGGDVKNEICKELKISHGTLYNCISKLRKDGFIIGKNTEFMLNPVMFWKGALRERKEAIKKINERANQQVREVIQDYKEIIND